MDREPLGIQFQLGEKKYVWFRVMSQIEQTVVITSATWELTDGESVLDSGTCEVEDNNLVKVLLEPKQKGVFMLGVVYHIPPETKKTGVSVMVC